VLLIGICLVIEEFKFHFSLVTLFLLILDDATWRVDPFLPRTRCPRTSILKNGMVVEKLPKNHLRHIRKRSCPSFSMSLSFPSACIIGQGLNFNPKEIEGTRIVFKN
jgi:hypothetical protein